MMFTCLLSIRQPAAGKKGHVSQLLLDIVFMMLLLLELNKVLLVFEVSMHYQQHKSNCWRLQKPIPRTTTTAAVLVEVISQPAYWKIPAFLKIHSELLRTLVRHRSSMIHQQERCCDLLLLIYVRAVSTRVLTPWNVGSETTTTAATTTTVSNVITKIQKAKCCIKLQ